MRYTLTGDEVKLGHRVTWWSDRFQKNRVGKIVRITHKFNRKNEEVSRILVRPEETISIPSNITLRRLIKL